jgi:phosphotriesterase-related protein
MSALSRRDFLITASELLIASTGNKTSGQERKNIMTVKGPIRPKEMGITLEHEHVLVDFVGAAMSNTNRWVKEEVVKKVLPLIKEVKAQGCKTFIDCTPNYLGRDPVLLQWLSELSEMNFITNTGYYGGSDNKFLPSHAFEESAEQLADRWIKEWNEGIGDSSVRPGFIKISVNAGDLSNISKKLITAAALTHLKTGLTIVSHTGPVVPALQQLKILKQLGITPEAFVWVHAQQEKDRNQLVKLAKMKCWISLDGLNDANVKEYSDRLMFLRKSKVLNRILISHDAGWYDPDKPGGGEIRGYTTLFTKLIPELEKRGFEESEVMQLIEKNPQDAFEIRVRKKKPDKNDAGE